VLKALHTAASSGDIKAYARSNFEFHRTIVAASGNLVLLQTWDSLSFDTKMRLNIAQSRPNLLDRVQEHDPIVAALQVGNGVKAGKLLRLHAESFMKFWEEQLPVDTPKKSNRVVMT